MTSELDRQFDNAKKWRAEAIALRKVLLDCGLDEERKWAKPCYVHDGDNICIIQRMNDFLALLFFKGALLDDPDGLLERQGPNSRSGFRMRFTSEADVKKSKKAVKDFVAQAIKAEKEGRKVKKAPPPKPPAELVDALDDDPEFREAFEALTPGRQRGYLLHFSDAKQSKTRVSRIARARMKIIARKGHNER